MWVHVGTLFWGQTSLPFATLILPPPPHLHGLPSQTNFAKWVMAATMTTMHDDDADEYDELSSTFADEMSIPKTIRKRLLYNPGRKGRFVVG